MNPTDKLKRRAIGAVHDHRQVYLDPAAVLKLIAENERLTTRNETLSHACMVAHIFVTSERECRESSFANDSEDEGGGYIEEAREVERILAEAVGCARHIDDQAEAEKGDAQ